MSILTYLRLRRDPAALQLLSNLPKSLTFAPVNLPKHRSLQMNTYNLTVAHKTTSRPVVCTLPTGVVLTLSPTSDARVSGRPTSGYGVLCVSPAAAHEVSRELYAAGLTTVSHTDGECEVRWH